MPQSARLSAGGGGSNCYLGNVQMKGNFLDNVASLSLQLEQLQYLLARRCLCGIAIDAFMKNEAAV